MTDEAKTLPAADGAPVERGVVPLQPKRAITTCDTCKHRTGWRTAFVTTGPQKMVVADCMHPDWPEWWKARNERPIVSPGAGSACKKYERHERHNVGAKRTGTQ